jgi:hypothetical protein
MCLLVLPSPLTVLKLMAAVDEAIPVPERQLVRRATGGGDARGRESVCGEGGCICMMEECGGVL